MQAPVQHKRISFLDLAAFLFGLTLAWNSSWTTRDMVWSLWLSSLFIGYATILSTISAGLYFACRLMQHKEFEQRQRGVFVLFTGGLALFLLVFFSFHFCGFHAAHAALLSGLFPLDGVNGSVVFGSAFTNPPRLLQAAWDNLVPVYGLFLLSTAIAESPGIFRPIWTIRRLIAEGEANEAAGIVVPAVKKGALPDPFAAPYKNVIKTHCLIFFFGLAHFAHLNSFAVFVVAYTVYFFPEFLLLVFRNAVPVRPGHGNGAGVCH